MNVYELAKETRELKKDIKKQKRELKSKIEPEVKKYKKQKNEIENYLEEALKEYKYKYGKLKVETIHLWPSLRDPDENIQILYYPFIEFKDIYEIKDEKVVCKYKKGDDYEYLHRSYVLRNRENGEKIKVEEVSIISGKVTRSLMVWIKIEGMKFYLEKDFEFEGL